MLSPVLRTDGCFMFEPNGNHLYGKRLTFSHSWTRVMFLQIRTSCFVLEIVSHMAPLGTLCYFVVSKKLVTRGGKASG